MDTCRLGLEWLVRILLVQFDKILAMMQKTPWAAALFNFLVPGAGYVYVGRRLKFGVLLIAGTALTIFGPAPEYANEAPEDIALLVGDPGVLVMAISALLIAAGFAYDGYNDAVEHNNKLAELGAAGDDSSDSV